MAGFEWGKRRRELGRGYVLPESALPRHDSSTYDIDPNVIEAEQTVAAALGRWATSAGLHGGDDEFIPYRTVISGRERIKLLAAAAREDQVI
ncbi:MAG: hypothetical protein WBP12_01360 [Candidatus Saccharimonas sp.]